LIWVETDLLCQQKGKVGFRYASGGWIYSFMHKLLTQLPLSLNLKDEATFENFYPGKNSEIITELKRTVLAEGEKIIYLCGTRGHGITHLLQACCHYAYQNKISSVYLPFNNLMHLSPELLHGLENLQLICIDDLQILAGNIAWEEALFHLFNRVYDAGGRIIFAANNIPKLIGITLPDLISRLSWGIVYQVTALVDAEKLTVLMQRASHRGMSLSEEVAKYLLTHCDRHIETLFLVLDKLDNASLAAQRRLTIPFVKEVLEI